MRLSTIVIMAGLLSLATAPAGGEAPALRLYMPQSVEVEGGSLTLGAIGVLSGNQQLVSRACEIPMGRAPWQKEKLVIDRHTVLSRLASSGIEAGAVTITGAEKVTVGRKETVFSPQQIIAAAEKLLEAQQPAPPGCGWRLVRQPVETVVPGGDVQLRPRLGSNSAAEEVNVLVAACGGQKELAASELVFKQTYQVRQAVASKDISAGQAVTADNVRIETVMADRPAEANWAPPYGMIARKHLPAGAVIGSAAVMAPKQVVIKRDQLVSMRLEGPGFRLSTVAQALQDGRCGDFIRVLNIDSRRVVAAKVASDGSVRPGVGEENRQ
jgi:flagella basal body P-ring formation protein FlgA